MKYKRLDEKDTQLVVAVLRDIQRELLRCYWNKTQKEMDSPFMNTGNEYMGGVFSVWAYDWSEGNETNFMYAKDLLRVCWYKHLGRGDVVEAPEDWTVDKLPDMLDNCLRAIRENFEK